MLLRAIAGFINTDKGYIKYNHKALHKDMDVLPDLGAVIENISFGVCIQDLKIWKCFPI